MSWTWGASSSFTEFTFLRRVCFSPRSPGGIRGIERFGEVAESTPNGHGRIIPWAPLLHALDTDEMLQAAVDFLHLWREQAPSKVPTTWGTIYRDERFPLIHEANLGWVSTRSEDGPKKIIEDLGEAFRGMAIPHQALLFEDAEKAFALQEEFVRLGFRPTAELALAKVGLPDCIVNPDLELRPAAAGTAMDDFRAITAATDVAFGHSRDVIEQLWGVWRERSKRVGMQPYVAARWPPRWTWGFAARWPWSPRRARGWAVQRRSPSPAKVARSRSARAARGLSKRPSRRSIRKPGPKSSESGPTSDGPRTWRRSSTGPSRVLAASTCSSRTREGRPPVASRR